MGKAFVEILVALGISAGAIAPTQAHADEYLVFDYLRYVDQQRVEVCAGFPTTECDEAYVRPAVLAASINAQLIALPLASILGGEKAYEHARADIDRNIAKLYRQLNGLAVRYAPRATPYEK